MTAVTKSTDELLRGPGKIVLAAYGTEPTEELGLHKEPIKISITQEMETDDVYDLIDPVDATTMSRVIKVSGKIAQVNKNGLAYVLGMTPDGGALNLDAPPEELRYALRVVSSRKDRSPVHLYLPHVMSNGNMEIDVKRGRTDGIGFEFTKLYGSGSKLLESAAVQAVTLSTGAAARTRTTGEALKYISWLRLTSETGTSDAFTDITAAAENAALADGEVVRVCAAQGQTITVTHASGVIETKDAADFILNSVSDWIDFYYDLTNTTWKEITRFDHDSL